MDQTLFTLLLIVPLVSGGSHPTCSSLSLTVEEGEDVSLWCGRVPSVNLRNFSVEFTRTDLSQYVLLYRDRRVLLDVQMEQYRNRTKLDLRGLNSGNITLQISSVKMSDSGDYTCFIPRLKPRCIITLHVVEQRNHVSAAPRLENNSTSNQPGKGAVAAIVVAVILLCSSWCSPVGGLHQTEKWKKQSHRELCGEMQRTKGPRSLHWLPCCDRIGSSLHPGHGPTG